MAAGAAVDVDTRRLAYGLAEHGDKTAGILIAQIQGDPLHTFAPGQSLQRQNHMQLPAPAAEAQAGHRQAAALRGQGAGAGCAG